MAIAPDALLRLIEQQPREGGAIKRYAGGGVSAPASGAAAPQFTPDMLSTLRDMWVGQYGSSVPVGPLAGGVGWYSNAPNPDTGPQQGTLNPTTLNTSFLGNIPASAAWLFQGLPGSKTLPKLTATVSSANAPGMQDGGIAEPSQMQQMLTMTPQQLQNMFMQQYSGSTGMAGGGVPSYEMLARLEKQNPPKGDSAGIPQRFADGGVASDPPWQPVRGGTTGMEAAAPDVPFQEGGVSRPDTGQYIDNPRVVTQLEHVAPYYYVAPQVAQPPPPRIVQDPATGAMVDLGGLGLLPRGQGPENFNFQGGGIVGPGGMVFDPAMMSFAQQQAPRQQPSPVAGEPAQAQRPQPKKYEFGPSDYYYELIPAAMQRLMEAQAANPQQGQGPPAVAAKEGGVIKTFLQHLAKGGMVKTPDDLILAGLGYKYGLSANQAQKRLKNSANLLPP